MRNTCTYIRIIALMLLMVTLMMTTAYAQEDKVVTPKVNGLNELLENFDTTQGFLTDGAEPVEEPEEVLEGVVLDANGTLWYMPEQIPLTFLSDEEESMIFKHKLYTETDKTFEDTRENYQIVWDYWYYVSGNAKGVAGLMGNINAESGFKSNNLQGSYERKFGMNDTTYTAAVDNGSYKNFVHDHAGYGLVQWTYWSLKARLLTYAQEHNASVGDIYLQLDFLNEEFTNVYPGCGKAIRNARTIKESSNYILLNFERPADQSVAAQNRRANAGENFYNLCIERCEMLDSIKLTIQQQLLNAADRMSALNMNYSLQSLWSQFLTGFYTNEPVMPGDLLNNAWDEILVK